MSRFAPDLVFNGRTLGPDEKPHSVIFKLTGSPDVCAECGRVTTDAIHDPANFPPFPGPAPTPERLWSFDLETALPTLPVSNVAGAVRLLAPRVQTITFTIRHGDTVVLKIKGDSLKIDGAEWSEFSRRCCSLNEVG